VVRSYVDGANRIAWRHRRPSTEQGLDRLWAPLDTRESFGSVGNVSGVQPQRGRFDVLRLSDVDGGIGIVIPLCDCIYMVHLHVSHLSVGEVNFQE